MAPRLGILIAPALLAAGCTAASPLPPVDGQVAAVTSEHGIRLTAILGASVVPAMEPIPYASSIEYVGPQAGRSFEAAGSGPVLHQVRRMDADAIVPQMGWNLDCSDFELVRGVPVPQPLRKTGSYDLGETGFWRWFLEDPELRLPPGHWAIDAVMRYYPERNCGGPETWLHATVVLTVATRRSTATPTPATAPGAT